MILIIKIAAVTHFINNINDVKQTIMAIMMMSVTVVTMILIMIVAVVCTELRTLSFTTGFFFAITFVARFVETSECVIEKQREMFYCD